MLLIQKLAIQISIVMDASKIKLFKKQNNDCHKRQRALIVCIGPKNRKEERREISQWNRVLKYLFNNLHF